MAHFGKFVVLRKRREERIPFLELHTTNKKLPINTLNEKMMIPEENEFYDWKKLSLTSRIWLFFLPESNPVNAKK